MSLSRITGFFSRLVGRGAKDSVLSPPASPDEAERFFARRHHSFKLFLTAWNSFQETMTDLEYTLCCDHPFGLYRVRALCTRMATQVFRCVKQLELLDPAPCAVLYERFNALQKQVADEVYEPESCLLGPLVVPLGQGDHSALRELRSGDTALVDPGTARVESLRAQFPDAVPQGFVITAAGCQHYFQSNGLQSEINRRIQAAGGLEPRSLSRLSRQLSELVEHTPLPEDLRAAVLDAVERLRAIYAGRAVQLLFRGRVWPPDAGEDCGVVLWGPPVSLHASNAAVLGAVLGTLARKQRSQALVYRRARGLTEIGTGVCITCMAVEEGCRGGIVQSRAPLRADSPDSYVYACDGLPQNVEYATMPVDWVGVSHKEPHAITMRHHCNPEHPVLDDETARRAAELAQAVEKAAACPQVLTWARTPSGRVLMLMARPMMSLPGGGEDADPTPPPAPAAEQDAPPLLKGGFTVCPGRVSGPAWSARRWEDARRFPAGGILIVPDDSYIWGSLIDRAAGIVVERGFPGSRLASLAREFGKPALFGLQRATEVVENGRRVTLCAELRALFDGRRDALLPRTPPGRDYMPGSPVHRILQNASRRILPLTLEVDSVDFKAANCATYHDIVRYCHERAVSAMFSLGSEKKHAPRRVKQLRDQVLKQFWVVNLSDGFVKTPAGPVIDVEDIASRPMLALWRGMNAHPWQGPPPVDGKGFLSVLFEATANPNLDPAAQTAYFTEKNYFLVSREYCSLHSRFGFHFVSVEARLSERVSENYLNFQLRGGAADIERRILRVRLVADILWEFGFAPVVRNDAVSATLKGLEPEEGEHLLAVAGYMTIHTRQLDMIMQDAAQVSARREEMLRHCRALYRGGMVPPQEG
ncbi:MAG: phosphoenolpyruvate synthase [Desulfovibrio desulfuricans]|jgi:pyruvate,water dikinase|nr:phosphoenolpyruvate synthase [Desulfovibrio desulfuricans]